MLPDSPTNVKSKFHLCELSQNIDKKDEPGIDSPRIRRRAKEPSWRRQRTHPQRHCWIPIGRVLRIRRFEEACLELRRRDLIAGSIHLCAGQEAIPVGAAAALGPEDRVIATYRGHGWALASGRSASSLAGGGLPARRRRQRRPGRLAASDVARARLHRRELDRRRRRSDRGRSGPSPPRSPTAAASPSSASATAPPVKARCTRAWCSPPTAGFRSC